MAFKVGAAGFTELYPVAVGREEEGETKDNKPPARLKQSL